MRRPAEIYQKSSRPFKGTPQELIYPQGFAQRNVLSSGIIRFHGYPIFISQAICGWNVGIQPRSSDLFSVYFAHLFIGVLDLSTQSFQSGLSDKELLS